MYNRSGDLNFQKMFSILLSVILFLAACQSATVEGRESNSQVLIPTTAAPSATTPSPVPTNTVAPTLTQSAAATEGPTSSIANSVSEATLQVADNPTLGKILVDGNGMTLYMYTRDSENKSTCKGACLEAWPPLLTQGQPILGEGVDDSLVGTAVLEDGSLIVTYNKMPLYSWYKDTRPGEVTGQGSQNVWYVVSPDGRVVGVSQTYSGDDYYYSP